MAIEFDIQVRNGTVRITVGGPSAGKPNTAEGSGGSGKNFGTGPGGGGKNFPTGPGGSGKNFPTGPGGDETASACCCPVVIGPIVISGDVFANGDGSAGGSGKNFPPGRAAAARISPPGRAAAGRISPPDRVVVAPETGAAVRSSSAPSSSAVARVKMRHLPTGPMATQNPPLSQSTLPRRFSQTPTWRDPLSCKLSRRAFGAGRRWPSR